MWGGVSDLLNNRVAPGRMMRIAVLLCFLLSMVSSDAGVLLKVEHDGPVKNLLADPGFQQAETSWKRFGGGFSWDGKTGRSDTFSIECKNSAGDTTSGAFQTIVLNQKSPRCIRASCWSKAEGVCHAARGNYALYLDIQYDDGSWVWGQLFDFAPGTHDWQFGEVVFEPERPIKLVNFYVILRQCAGRCWFDDCRLEELDAPDGKALFDQVTVTKVKSKARTLATLRTEDGMRLNLTDKSFYIRDVAAGSDFLNFDLARTPSGEFSGSALGITITIRPRVNKNHISFDCKATETTGRDRAITIGFALPVSPTGKRWWHSIRSSEEVRYGWSYCDGVPIEAGAVGQMSKYPFACLGDTCLCISMDEPCVYRIGYNGWVNWYYIAFDLGFCPEKGVSDARFSFVIYKVDPALGMRACADKYYHIFPHFFTKRVKHEGNWMAFRQVSSVKDWQDFGFAFHEGENDIAWDAQNGIYSFRYTEPMSYWMPLGKDVPRTVEKAMELIENDFRGQNRTKRGWASAVKLCLTYDEEGRPRVYFFNAPWCDGAMFVLNCNPAIPKGDFPATRASMSWSKEIAESLYGKEVSPQLAGEYLDSAEMASDYVNTRREHFAYVTRPLSFARRTKKPAILQALSTYEFARAMADDVHARGKLMMANTVPTKHGFMGHLFDVMGTETNWLRDGKYVPPPDDMMDFRRTICYQKPYCFLMNTDYEAFGRPMVEKYMQWCMFWGMFPSFFSPDAATRLYFEQPKYYERDRDLFKKYMPVIKRIARAGWEPLTMAHTSDARVEVERFGPGNGEPLFFTIRNLNNKPLTASVFLEEKLGMAKHAMKLPNGMPLDVVSGVEIKVPLEAGEVAVVEVRND